MAKIAAQLYTLRDTLSTPAEIADTLKKVREIGYEAVQISGIKAEIAPAELKKICDDNGLTVCATHCGMANLTERIDQLIEDHKIYDCAYTALASIPGDRRDFEGYKQTAKDLTEAGKKLADNGITLCYHNHAFELQKYDDGRTGLAILYEDSDPQFLQGEIDTYWIAYGGGEPTAWCKRLVGRLPLVHFKDMTIVDNQHQMTEIGEGNLNWKDICLACKEAGTRWYIVEQDVCQRDPLESLKISLENMKQMPIG